MESSVISTRKSFTLDKFASQVKVVGNSSIKNILNISAYSVVGNCENLNQIITLSGKIIVNVLYLTNDGIIESASAEADFIEKQKFEFNLSDIFVDDKLMVENINFSSNEIICSVRHNTQIIGIYNYEMLDINRDNGLIFTNTNKINSSRFICSAEDDFQVSEEIETTLKDIDILMTNAFAVVDDVSCSVDKVVIDGHIVVYFIFKDGENISSNSKQIEFKQEISAESTLPNMKANSFVSIKNASVTLEQKDDGCVLAYNIDIYSKSYVFENYEYEVATDMFMTSNEVDLVYNYIDTNDFIEMIEQSESVLSQTDITHIVDFEDLIGVYFPKIKIEKIENNEDKSQISAKISAIALYKSQNGIEKLDVSSDVSFDIVLNINNFISYANACCEIVSSKVKAGKELEIVFKTNCHANISNKTSLQIVKSYDIKTQKQTDDAGIKVYIAKENQSIFDIAKALSVNPQLIALQNHIDGVLESGQKVYVYSPINFA